MVYRPKLASHFIAHIICHKGKNKVPDIFRPKLYVFLKGTRQTEKSQNLELDLDYGLLFYDKVGSQLLELLLMIETIGKN